MGWRNGGCYITVHYIYYFIRLIRTASKWRVSLTIENCNYIYYKKISEQINPNHFYFSIIDHSNSIIIGAEYIIVLYIRPSNRKH